MNYPDKNGNDVDIFLYLDGENQFIPAPKYYWKVLMNEAKKEAVAFVGLNDPHSENIDEDEYFCNSVCGQGESQ